MIGEKPNALAEQRNYDGDLVEVFLAAFFLATFFLAAFLGAAVFLAAFLATFFFVAPAFFLATDISSEKRKLGRRFDRTSEAVDERSMSNNRY
jgi:hypothetical protein